MVLGMSRLKCEFFSSTSKERGDMADSASPKFIVTLDGVPSPQGNVTDCDMELDDVRPPTRVTEATAHLNKEPKVSILHRLQGGVRSSEGMLPIVILYCNYGRPSQVFTPLILIHISHCLVSSKHYSCTVHTNSSE